MSSYLPGDIVSRRKGFVMHKGIALGDGRVLHNTPFRGEHISTEHEFRNGQRLYVTSQDRARRERALLHAEGIRQGRSYSLLTNNCEHTVSRASTGRAQSPQLLGWAAGLAVGLAAGVAAGAVAFAVTRHPAAAAAGFAAMRGWVNRRRS